MNVLAHNLIQFIIDITDHFLLSIGPVLMEDLLQSQLPAIVFIPVLLDVVISIDVRNRFGLFCPSGKVIVHHRSNIGQVGRINVVRMGHQHWPAGANLDGKVPPVVDFQISWSVVLK